MIFIYKKENKIKALSVNEALELNNKIKEAGWKHTSTLDPCRFLEYLHNNDNLYKAIKSIKEL